MSVAPGTLIAKKYRIERVIGEGGMGVVVAARHVELGRRVAIKLVRKDAIAAGSIERLVREARAAASIESDHVARVLDVGRTKDGEPYLVMEHLDGQDLHARGANGPARVDEAVGWILEACEGLAAAHARGIVHRDLKPSNLFLARTADGRETVKLLDFGLAKSFTNDDDGRITETGAILGSPSYMSPEHLSGRALDARSDVWSLGVTLYELLARELPFPPGTTPQICAAVLASPHVPIALRRADVPDELARVIDACLEKDPALRPRDVAELAARLEPFCAGATGAAERVARTLEQGAVEPALRFFEPHEAPTHLVSAVDSPARVRSLATIGVAALVAIGLAVTLVAFAVRREPPPTQAAPPETTSAPAPIETASIAPIETVTITALPQASIAKPRSKPRNPAPKSSASSSPLERF